ncbi:MAG: 8-oxoguanine deaminase [Pseudomonadaceae bacterium]|nr:8-oxoguanine deaminase [Pseudomonadaceae bacterium]
MTTTWIRNPCASFDGQVPGRADGGLIISGNTIAQVLAAGETPSHPIDVTIDASDMVLLPGLINTHHHFYQTLTRAHKSALNKPLFAWLTALYPLWANLTNDMVEIATELALAELMLSGCTTTTDHHYVFSDQLDEAIDRQVHAADRLGMRVVLTRGSMSLGQSSGGLPPDHIVQAEQTILDECERLIRDHHQSTPFAMTQIALAPCSPFSVTAELMQACATLADEHDVLLHTHLAETHDETEFCLQHSGLRPVDYLQQLGWINSKAWFAHGIHFDSQEIKRLGSAGCGVSHCPSSNMILASGICPAAALEAAGVNVGLGVDGSASNDCSNLIQEVRQALLIQRLAESQEASTDNLTSHLDALRWATQGGANLLHRSELGRLVPGAAADIALFKLDQLRFSGSDDPLAALILSGAHRAEAVMINGQWRIQHGALVNTDLGELMARHQQQARKLWAAL